MNDLAYNDCNYKFKGNSCNECPLDCIYKNRNDMYRAYKLLNETIVELKAENVKLKDKLEKIKKSLHTC